MKSLLLLLITVVTIATVSAQTDNTFTGDILYRTDGKTMTVKVEQIKHPVIKYKRMSDLDDSNASYYYILIEKVDRIEYANGEIQKMADLVIEPTPEEPKETIKEKNTSTYSSTVTEIPLTRPTIKEEEEEKKIRRHVVYGEFLGMSGFFSANYLPTIVSSPNGAFQIKTRIGIGMSNKSFHVPHGILFGFGSANHQFELGFQAALISGFAEGDVFEFLHSDGRSLRYSFSPTIGYRLISKSGFTFNVNILLISAENASGIYAPLIGNTRELSPWFGIGLGYAF